MQPTRRETSLAVFVKPGVILGILLSLSIGALAYYVTVRTIENENEVRFQNMARNAQFTINARIKSYTYVLRATGSLFAVTPNITSKQFHYYVDRLDLPTYYPAIETLNYMEWVTDAGRDAFEARMRRQQQAEHRPGPPFRIHPPGRRSSYSVLTIIEPAEFARFLGRDMFAIEAYRKKFRESVDSGEIGTSGLPVPVMLEQKRLGLAMRLPVYQPGTPLETVEQRRAAFRGSVGIAFNVPLLVQGVLDEVPVKPVRFNLFNTNELVDTKPTKMIYDSAATKARPAPPIDFDDTTEFHVWLPIDFNGYKWVAHFSAPKEAVNRNSDTSLPLVALVAGFTSTMLLYGLYYTLTSSRSRALELARDMTKELRESEGELLRSHQKLRQLAAHAEHIKEVERKRIAREIHDELGQNLLALRIEAELLFSRTRERHPRLHKRAGATIEQIDTAIRSVRQIINDLRPNVLDLGLNAAVDWQISEFRRRTGIECDLFEHHPDIRVNDHFATALFRILQESLTNVQRHARASWVRVDVQMEQNWVKMSIRDNGIGLVGNIRKPGSFGLIGMEERVKMLGGRFSLSGAPGVGTEVEVALPIQQENSHIGQHTLPSFEDEHLQGEQA